MKFICGVVGLLALTIVGVLFYASSIISGTIEKIGSEAVGAPVTINSMILGFLSGKSSISGFSVANPSGFKSPKAISLGEVYIDIDLASVLSDKIHIKEVRITAPAVFYEGLLKKNNFKTIQNNINKFTGSSKQNEVAQGAVVKTETSDNSKPAKKIQLDLFIMEEAEMSLVMATPIGTQNTKVMLPKIVVKDIGKEGGASAAEVVQKVTAPLLAHVSKAAVGAFANVDDLKKDAEIKIKGEIDKVKDKALGGLKGLFGK